MLLHRVACAALPATCAVAIYFQSSAYTEPKPSRAASTITSLASAVLAAGVVYTRYRQVCRVGSLTEHAPILLLVNRAAVVSANVMFLCFLLFATFFLFEVNNICSTVGDIFVYGLGTLYIWMQCIVTSYLSPLYYSKNLTLLRLGLASLSFIVLIVMLVSGLVANILHKGGVGGQHSGDTCLEVNVLCHHLAAALFCIFITSFDRDCKHLTILPNDLLLDDRVSVCSTPFPESTTYGPQHIFSYTSNILRRSLVPPVS